MKKIGFLFTVIIMAMLFVVSASAATEGYYTYEVENGEATISDVRYSISGDVTIPDTLGGYPVISIGNEAFYGCDNLTSITIPDSVTSIGSDAFYSCDGLTSITIPDSVTTIGDDVFSYCDSLESIVVDKDNKDYSSIDGVLFDKTKETLIIYPAGKKNTAYTIPNSVSTIGDDAFYECINLTSVTIPDSVTSIGDQAFYYCEKLTSISIPDSVTTIGIDAFEGCYSLREVYITDLVDWYAIDFESIGSNPLWNPINDMGLSQVNLYLNNKLVKDLVIPDGVTTIKDYAFAGCGISSVTIPESVTTIGKWAFMSCSNLTSIIVVENNQHYSNDEFGVLFNKDKTELIQFPLQFPMENLYDIYELSDRERAELFELIVEEAIEYTIPDTVKVIGDGAFFGCWHLKSLNIPDGVTTIGDYAWTFSPLMYHLYIPGSVTDIGDIINNSGALSVELGEGITNLNYDIMRLVRNARNILIPKTVTKIIFSYCEVEEIFYAGTEEQWNDIELSEADKEFLENVNIHFNVVCNSHKYNSELFYVPNCEGEGGYKYTCENCGWYYYEICFDFDNHDMSEWSVDTPATCTAPGVESRYCKREHCNFKYVETRELPKKSHTMSDWVVTVAPTCTADGSQYRNCTVCGGAYESKKIAATYHKDSNKDNICDNCSESIDTSGCSCNCHKNGFMGFIWKIVLFFSKLFKTNRACTCGVAHY